MKILMIEDDKQMAMTIKDQLKNEYLVDWANTGEKGEEMAIINDYDIVLLDLKLPDMDGSEVCRKIRKNKIQTPILILTGRVDVKEKVKNLDLGADDYLIKPFHFEELLARIRALIRRKTNTIILTNQLTVDDLVLDTNAKTVKRKGQSIDLRQKEFQLLEYLMQNQGRVLNRNQILWHVWSTNIDSLTNTVDVHIQSLRSKIDKPFENPLIKTVYGFGYVLKSDTL